MPKPSSPANTGALRADLNALNRLVEISVMLASTLDLQPLLNYTMQAATEITNAEAASILLVEEGSGELRFAAASGADAQGLIGLTVPVEHSIAGTVLMRRQPCIIHDVSQHPRHFQRVDRWIDFHTRSILGVPMTIREQPVGVLEVINKRTGRFGEDDVRYMTLLATQAAAAIHNAQLVRSLEKAYEDLKRLHKLKTDFIAIASHELRTPLSMILGYATFLQEEAQGEISEHAEAVLNSALQLSSLIESMTNLRYVVIDDSELELQPLPLGGLLREAYREILPLTQAKGQCLELREPPAPYFIRADHARLSLALTNVLHNAVKFTPEGGVILLSAERSGDEVWITVRDNGIGIPPEELERIFEAFYQVEDPLTRRHGGLGLGLTIARAIMERHGGRIWAASAGPNMGSRFTLALPLLPSQQEGQHHQ